MGSVSGTLAQWGVGEESTATVSLESELDLNSAIFSLSFDPDMKLVSEH